MNRLFAITLLLITGCVRIQRNVHSLVVGEFTVNPQAIERFGQSRHCDLIVGVKTRCGNTSYPAYYEVGADEVSFLVLNSFGSRMFLARTNGVRVSIDHSSLWSDTSADTLFVAFQVLLTELSTANYLVDGSQILTISRSSDGKVILNFASPLVEVTFSRALCLD